MASATLSVKAGFTQTNDQRTQKYYGQLTVSAVGDVYPAGGFALDSVLTAALAPNTNTAAIFVRVSGAGGGFIYQRIPSTGKLMVLQIPPNGSLTTAAPLQELPSNSTSLSGVFNDTIQFEAVYLRNA